MIPLILYCHASIRRYPRVAVKTLELRLEDLPLTVRLRLPDTEKEYVLLKTKKDKLLLVKPVEVSNSQNR